MEIHFACGDLDEHLRGDRLFHQCGDWQQLPDDYGEAPHTQPARSVARLAHIHSLYGSDRHRDLSPALPPICY